MRAGRSGAESMGGHDHVEHALSTELSVTCRLAGRRVTRTLRLEARSWSSQTETSDVRMLG